MKKKKLLAFSISILTTIMLICQSVYATEDYVSKYYTLEEKYDDLEEKYSKLRKKYNKLINAYEELKNSLQDDTTTEEENINTPDIDDMTSDISSPIELIAGELGDYGQKIVLSGSLPDNNYCYFIPSGIYKIKNIGEYPTQIDVNKNEIATDIDNNGDEYEYWPEGTPYMIAVGATEEITVKDGYFIEIEVPTHLLLTPVS